MLQRHQQPIRQRFLRRRLESPEHRSHHGVIGETVTDRQRRLPDRGALRRRARIAREHGDTAVAVDDAQLPPGGMWRRCDHVGQGLVRGPPGLEAPQAEHPQPRIGPGLRQNHAEARRHERHPPARRHARRRQRTAELAGAWTECGDGECHVVRSRILIAPCTSARRRRWRCARCGWRRRRRSGVARIGRRPAVRAAAP
jgi:hypothetical protein